MEVSLFDLCNIQLNLICYHKKDGWVFYLLKWQSLCAIFYVVKHKK